MQCQKIGDRFCAGTVLDLGIKKFALERKRSQKIQEVNTEPS